VPSVDVFDVMDRHRSVRTADGAARLTLSTLPQYMVIEREPWAVSVAEKELYRRLETQGVDSVAALESAIAQAAASADEDAAAMNRLYHLLLAAKQAALAGRAPQTDQPAETNSRRARAAVENREGADGYLREARTMLYWTERFARVAAEHEQPVRGGMAWVTGLAAGATKTIAAGEDVIYPGVVVNAYLETAALRKTVLADEPLDEKFPMRIDRRPGETFELELTVWDYYRHPIEGTVTPRLPAGWTASPETTDYRLEPGCFHRQRFRVTIPSTASEGEYDVGGQTFYNARPVEEIHSHRVRVIR
jgi:hypothetical protein